MYRVMLAANKHTPGREVSRKETLEAAKRSCAAHLGKPGGKDSTIWIEPLTLPRGEATMKVPTPSARERAQVSATPRPQRKR